jgi:hypothetical protein
MVTAQQIHSAWTEMSETLWKRDANQLVSARTFLEEHSDDVDVFEIKVDDRGEQLCWGLKKVMLHLQGKIVEIAMDATYKTYQNHSRNEGNSSDVQIIQTQGIWNCLASLPNMKMLDFHSHTASSQPLPHWTSENGGWH